MGKREEARAEAKFLRGEAGVDGASVKDEVDPVEAEQASARDALYRGRTWLGREALTWLLWRSESTEPVCTVDGQPLTALFTGKLLLRAAAGDVTEVALKGVAAPYAKLVREAAKKGLLVHAARLTLQHGEQTFEVTLDAEHFDLRAAKLPALLSEDDSEKLAERLELVARLSRLVDGLLAEFSALRTSPRWKKAAAEIRQWVNAAD